MDLANLFSLVWFLLLSLGAKIFKQKCLVSGTKHQGLQHGHRGWAALPSWLLQGWGGDRSPAAQGEVIALFTCWGAQQRPFTPEVLDKSPWIQRASYLADKIKPWIVSLRNLHFENLAFESLNMFMPRSCPCEIVSNRWRSRSQLHGCLLNTWSQQKSKKVLLMQFLVTGWGSI